MDCYSSFLQFSFQILSTAVSCFPCFQYCFYVHPTPYFWFFTITYLSPVAALTPVFPAWHTSVLLPAVLSIPFPSLHSLPLTTALCLLPFFLLHFYSADLILTSTMVDSLNLASNFGKLVVPWAPVFGSWLLPFPVAIFFWSPAISDVRELLLLTWPSPSAARQQLLLLSLSLFTDNALPFSTQVSAL